MICQIQEEYCDGNVKNTNYLQFNNGYKGK